MLELTVHVVKDLLPRGLESIKAHLCLPNRDTILPIPKSGPRFVGELVERHTDRPAVFDIRLMFGVMQFGLNDKTVSYVYRAEGECNYFALQEAGSR